MEAEPAVNLPFRLAGVQASLYDSAQGSSVEGTMGSGGKRLGLRLCSLIFSVLLTLPVYADDFSDHDRARQALEAGEILPLKTVLEKVERNTPGRVLEVELERRNNRWVYEIKLLLSGGARAKD